MEHLYDEHPAFPYAALRRPNCRSSASEVPRYLRPLEVVRVSGDEERAALRACAPEHIELVLLEKARPPVRLNLPR